nr:adenosine deaminase [Parasteatoda tepidariorum]
MEELKNSCVTRTPSTLANFLKPISMYLPAVIGDPESIERIAFEFCEDAAKDNLCYVEIRYSPHLLASTHGNVTFPHVTRTVSPSDVVDYVNRGLSKGSATFGIKVRSILCGIRGRTGWMEDVVKLCSEYRYQKVVGIDVAGEEKNLEDTTAEEAAAFKLPSMLHWSGREGDHRKRTDSTGVLSTQSPDKCIYLENFSTSRSQQAVEEGDTPIITQDKFAEDGANFSINRDDPTLIQKTLDDDYTLLRNLGLREAHFARANFNAARSSFLPTDEKKELIQYLKRVYGTE